MTYTQAPLLWMIYARNLTSLSPNLGRKTSCVFVRDGHVIAEGVNTFPPCVIHMPDRLKTEARYLYVEHAERYAIGYAARLGISLAQSDAYMPWFPCVECARMLVLVGVRAVCCTEPDWSEERYHFNDARTILQEGGVEIIFHKAAQ